MSIYDRLKNQPLMRMQEGGYVPPVKAVPPRGYVSQQNQPSSQINLGGGLGGFSMPQIPLETILSGIPNLQGNIDFSNLPGAPSTTPEIPLETLSASLPENFQFNTPEGVDLTNLNPTIFGTPYNNKDLVLPDVPNDYVEETDVVDETIAEGTIDPTTGFTWNGTKYVRPGDIDDTFVWNVETGAWEPTTAPVMPAAPVADPVVEVVSTEVADEVVADPVADPVVDPVADPVVDTSGIGTLPEVVLPPADAEDMDLITGTDAPLTEEEIYNVATPTMTQTTGNDLALLNQQYNDTFLKMLVQNPVNTQGIAGTSANNGMNADGTSTGVVGTPNLPGTLPDNTVQQLGQGQYGLPNVPQYQQQYSTPADVQFQMQNVFGNGNGFPNNNNINNQNYNNPYEQYGNLVFPTFGSGVTSLVPPDTMYNLK